MSQRAPVHPGPASVAELLILESIALRLAATYPPDWLERHCRQLHGATLAASFAAAMLLGLAWGAWWAILLPLLMPTLVLVVLPRCLFGRDARRPRWAHPRALLDRRDADLVRRIVAPGPGAALGGDRFFETWQHARSSAGYRND